MNAHGTNPKGPLQRVIESQLGREISPEELAEARRRLSQIAEVLSAIQARRDAARAKAVQDSGISDTSEDL